MAQISSSKCKLCTEKIGVFYCYECQHALCGLCRQKHDKIPATKGHTVTNFQNVDLATCNTRSQCVLHEREFLFYCNRCSDLICSKCVTSTHQDHHLSEITDRVSKERDKAKKKTIPELKVEMKKISTFKEESMKQNSLDMFRTESQKVLDDIGTTYVEIRTFIETIRDKKITAIEDNSRLAHQNYESFLQNVDQIDKIYTSMCSKLENILLEKHDLTFYMCYKTLQYDIKNLPNLPERPKKVEVSHFNKGLFYSDTINFIQSKVDYRYVSKLMMTKY